MKRFHRSHPACFVTAWLVFAASLLPLAALRADDDPQGGMERTATGQIPVKILGVD